MIRIGFIGLSIAALLTGCGGPQPSPQQKVVRTQNNAVWETRQAVSMNGKVYEVAIRPARDRAFVGPKGNFAYTARDLERVAAKVSGCQGTYDGGVLEFLGGFSKDTDLNEIDDKVKNFRYWGVTLSC